MILHDKLRILSVVEVRVHVVGPWLPWLDSMWSNTGLSSPSIQWPIRIREDFSPDSAHQRHARTQATVSSWVHDFSTRHHYPNSVFRFPLGLGKHLAMIFVWSTWSSDLTTLVFQTKLWENSRATQQLPNRARESISASPGNLRLSTQVIL